MEFDDVGALIAFHWKFKTGNFVVMQVTISVVQ